MSRISFCETCIKLNKGRALSPVEAQQHQDAFPDHQIVSVDKTDEELEQFEQELNS